MYYVFKCIMKCDFFSVFYDFFLLLTRAHGEGAGLFPRLAVSGVPGNAPIPAPTPLTLKGVSKIGYDSR